jgi:hypothetical protein
MGRWLKSSSGFATVGVAMAMVAASVLALAGVGSRSRPSISPKVLLAVMINAAASGADGSARRKVPGEWQNMKIDALARVCDGRRTVKKDSLPSDDATPEHRGPAEIRTRTTRARRYFHCMRRSLKKYRPTRCRRWGNPWSSRRRSRWASMTRAACSS